MSKLIRISYEIITHESAEHGEAVDRGWIDEEGEDMTPDEYDREDEVTAADKAIDFLRDEGVSEPSSSHFHRGIWYKSEGDEDPGTGAVEYRSFHLSGFTEEEEKEIFKAIAPRWNPSKRRRSSAKKRNPTPFTKKGKKMMRAIERRGGYGKRSPGVAAATVYARAKKGAPGLVKKRWAKKRGYPVNRRNPSANEFQEGAARALWVDLFATEVEALRDEGHEDLYEELSPGAGGDWMDFAPETPETAYESARKFEKELVAANQVADIDALMRRAARADGMETEDDIDQEEFGHYNMMSALGHGVSWFDAHEDFLLKLPSWEASSEVYNEMYDFLESKKEME